MLRRSRSCVDDEELEAYALDRLRKDLRRHPDIKTYVDVRSIDNLAKTQLMDLLPSTASSRIGTCR
jgi:hypothetical protein